MSTPDWIAFKDREPTQADLPVVALDHNGEHFVFKRIQCTPGWHKAWVWWKPIGEPKLRPQIILRHPDGREKVITEPVYTAPAIAEPGDEYYDQRTMQWEVLTMRHPAQVSKNITRRRIA